MKTKWLVGALAPILTFAIGNVGGGIAQAAPAAQATSLSDVISSTGAYGSNVSSQLASIRSGATAPASVSCTAAAPVVRTNSAATLTVPALGRVGAVDTSARTAASSTTKAAHATSTTAGVNLLDGLITSSALKSNSSVTVNSSGTTTASGAANLADLRIGGVEVAANPAPNTTIALRVGDLVIGKVVLNERVRSADTWSASVTTRAISVYISSKNPLGLPLGTRIIVGSSKSALEGAPAGKVGGSGFSVRSRLADGTVKSGSYAPASVPCLGGVGRASVASTGVPGVIDAGAAETEATGTVGASSTSKVTNTITGLSLLGGVISADAITTSGSTSRSGAGQPVQVTDTSKVANLRLAGIPVLDGDVAPNSAVTIPGIAKVTLHKVVKSSSGISITMLEIKLEKAFGNLPTGSVIEVGHSQTSVG